MVFEPSSSYKEVSNVEIIRKSKRNPGDYYIKTNKGFLHAFCSAVLPNYQNLKEKKREEFIKILLIQLKLHLISENKHETHKSILEIYGGKDPRKELYFENIALNTKFFKYYKDVSYVANISNKFFDATDETIRTDKEMDFAYMCFLAHILKINVDVNNQPAVEKKYKVIVFLYHSENFNKFEILARKYKDTELFVTKF